MLTRDERELLWATSEGVHSWDLATERLTSAWPGYGTLICLSPDGSKLLSVNWRSDNPWRILATKSGAVIASLAKEMSGGQIAAFSPDGERLATADSGEIRLWATASGQLLNSAKVPESPKVVRFVRSDGRFILVGGAGSYLWDTSTADARELSAPGSAVVITADVSLNANSAITGDDTGVLRRWHTETWNEQIIGEHKGAKVVATTEDGRLVASAGVDGVIRLWSDPPSDSLATSLSRQPGPPTPVAVLDSHDGVAIDALLFTGDGARLVAASSHGVLKVWDVQRARLSAGVGGLRPLAFSSLSPNGRYLVGNRIAASGTRCRQRSRDRFGENGQDAIRVHCVL